MAQLVLARAEDANPGLLGPGQPRSHAALVSLAATRAAWIKANAQSGPLHIAVLLDNVEEFILWLEACALVGATLVGANPTHRGEELARDLAHTEIQMLVTSSNYLPLVDGLELGAAFGKLTDAHDRLVVVDHAVSLAAVESHGSVNAHDIADPSVDGDSLGYLIFTSGTSGAPKAVRCTQGRLASISQTVASNWPLTAEDVCYVAMPLFHSNALMAGWGPSLAGGSAVGLPTGGRFSATGFLPDVRSYGATYFNYVGKPLSYVLATPEQDDDANNSLRLCFGNEAAAGDPERFGERFGCIVVDAYGSTEGGASLTRFPGAPAGALGQAGEAILVVNADSGEECPRAIFDDEGRITNAETAIGEMVSRSGGAGFEGYWQNDEAERARLRDGWYWTGDLAYRDDEDWVYFAGRDSDWIRVDGENFAAAPVERILGRFPGVVLASAYAVPDESTGDQVMVAFEWNKDAPAFDAVAFCAFLAEQSDLGTKWAPRYVRITEQLPVTATSKVLKRSLRSERWNVKDPIWIRDRIGNYRLLDEPKREELNSAVGDRVL